MSPVWSRKAGALGSAADPRDRRLERAGHVGVGVLVEADMAVADLDEGEAGSGSAACASSIRSERGTPPATVQTTPVPTQAMHFEQAAPVRWSSP